MRKALVVAAALAVVLLGACSSTPEPVEPPDGVYDQAKALRAEIIDLELAEYSQDQFDSAESDFNQGETHYEAQQYADAEASFNSAITNYEQVLRTGLQARRSARKTSADEAKTRADVILASVAVPQEYEEALTVYEAAQAAADAGNDKQAAELFENAETLFEQAYQLAAEKKTRAESAVGNLQTSLDSLDARRVELENEARDELSTTGTGEGE